MRIRAGVLDLDTVAALGVNVRLLRTLNFAVGIFLAGLAGRAGGRADRAQPQHGRRSADAELHRDHRGRRRVSLTGTLLGGLLIGVAAALTTVFFPSASEAVIYVIMAIVLLVRPRGLFGEEGLLT